MDTIQDSGMDGITDQGQQTEINDKSPPWKPERGQHMYVYLVGYIIPYAILGGGSQ